MTLADGEFVSVKALADGDTHKLLTCGQRPSGWGKQDSAISRNPSLTRFKVALVHSPKRK